MNDSKISDLKPLADIDGDPVFDELWQAQALAMADSLVQNGLFSAQDWSAALGKALTEAEANNETDNHETYYRCVLSALESLIAINSDIDDLAMTQKRKDWESAYRATPHGQPVVLHRVIKHVVIGEDSGNRRVGTRPIGLGGENPAPGRPRVIDVDVDLPEGEAVIDLARPHRFGKLR